MKDYLISTIQRTFEVGLEQAECLYGELLQCTRKKHLVSYLIVYLFVSFLFYFKTKENCFYLLMLVGRRVCIAGCVCLFDNVRIINLQTQQLRFTRQILK